MSTASAFANAMAEQNLSKLVGDDSKKNEGSFVYSSQGVASAEGFGHVSKLWYPKTLSYEAGLAQIEAGRAQTEDILCTVDKMTPAVDPQGNFAFRCSDGRYFKPTPHAMEQVGNWARTGTWFVRDMLVNPTDVKGKELYARDSIDANTLARVVANGFRRIEADKKFLFRTRKDGTMRAMLTDRYAIVDNRWLVELMSKIIPGGRLSHWRGDSDTLYGNILIPDTIREDSDSDYGGMLSLSNSEIGERRIGTCPSIFRAICMNGCIWGATKGQRTGKVHRGKINLNELANAIRVNLQAQIPLLPQGINKLLSTRMLGWDGADAKVVIAGVAGDFKLSKKQATAVLQAWGVEAKQTPDLAKTLFGITNAVTRAGQTFDNSSWVDFDEAGGKLLAYSKDDFAKLVSRAKSLSVEDVEEVYSSAV
jgi:hypothetical protein